MTELPPPQIPDHTLLQRIGRGAYGEVWLARNITGSFRAIKIVWRKSFETDRPFEREFEGIKKFEPISRSHQGLVNILHVGRNDEADYFFYVMELADSVLTGAELDFVRYEPKTLKREIDEHSAHSIPDCVRIGLRLANALGFLHSQSLVHRDIKPANIIFVKGMPKLADIGLVCETEATQTLVGTEGYIAPEGSGSPQADLYSLGKVLYELATGKPRDAFPDLPTDLRENAERSALLEFNEVVLKACATDARQRYQSAQELEADLSLLEMGRSVRQKRGRERHWATFKLSIGVGAAVVLIFLVLSMVRNNSHQTSQNENARSVFQKASIIAGRSSSHLEGEKNNPRIIELLETAVSLDPDFAEAHADLALAYTIRLFLYAPEEKNLQEKAYLHVERALALNSNLPTAYLARGRLKWTPFHHFPHEDAIKDFLKALSLDPNLAEAHHYLGLVFIHVGLLEEGLQEFSKAVALAPSNNGAHYRIGETWLAECKFQKALDKFETIDADFNPDLRAAHIGVALLGLGRKEEAEKSLKAYRTANPEDKGGLVDSVEAIIHAQFAREAEAERAIQSAATKRGRGHFHHTQYHIASAYAVMNKKDLALEWFRKSVAEGLNSYPLFECDPNLANLKTDPRFLEILSAEKKRYDQFKSKYGTK